MIRHRHLHHSVIQQSMPNIVIYIAPTQRLEVTTPAVRNPGVTVELEPGVSGGGRKSMII